MGLTTSAPQNIAVTINPTIGTTACDLGAPYIGAIPAAATQAGMTHCAFNYDFTQTQSFTDQVGTHQWCSGGLVSGACNGPTGNMSNWFTCSAHASASQIMATLRTYGGSGATVACDTSHLNVINDGSGTQVLAMSFLPSDASNSIGGTEYDVQLGTNDTPLPDQYYYEVVLSITSTHPCSTVKQQFCLNFDTSIYTLQAGTNCFIAEDSEFDQFRSTSLPDATGTVAPAYWQCNPSGGWSGTGGVGPKVGCCSYTVPPDIPALGPSYLTYGTLTTTDGSSQYSTCSYTAPGAVSGLNASSFQGCSVINPAVPGSQTYIWNARMFLYILTAPSGSQANQLWTPTSPWSIYLRRLTIWECSGWQSSNCYNNPVISTHP